MPEAIERARALLEEITPLAEDCGQVCDGRCCQATAESVGMLLFPGEEALPMDEGFRLQPAEGGGTLLTCAGHCDRALRPLACRMFPLFPYVGEDGRVRAVYDPRGWRLCPLVRECAHVPLQREFVRAVRRAGRILMEDPACAAFLRQNSAEIRELDRLTGLGEERPPIARRRP
ncbi:MAG: hypothetical protein IJ518_04965 [Clostridia bacterium]|nr:hypothetical protein [Clostridia bacterium]